MAEEQFKLTIVGLANAGKTEFFNKLSNSFASTRGTQGHNFKEGVKVLGCENVKLTLFDMAGG